MNPGFIGYWIVCGIVIISFGTFLIFGLGKECGRLYKERNKK